MTAAPYHCKCIRRNSVSFEGFSAYLELCIIAISADRDNQRALFSSKIIHILFSADTCNIIRKFTSSSSPCRPPSPCQPVSSALHSLYVRVFECLSLERKMLPSTTVILFNPIYSHLFHIDHASNNLTPCGIV